MHGARSWLGVGNLGVQPSEFAKLTTLLFLGAYLSSIGKRIRELPRFLLALAIVLLPMGLILLQPDMGTALVYLPIFLAMTFIAGAQGEAPVLPRGLRLAWWCCSASCPPTSTASWAASWPSADR